MALLLTSHTSLFSQQKPKNLLPLFSLKSQNSSVSFSSIPPNPRFSSLRILHAFSGENPDRDQFPAGIPIESGENPIEESIEKAVDEIKESFEGPKGITDEWGENAEPGAEEASATKLPEADPPKYEDEWGTDGGSAESADYISGNGSAGAYDKASEEYDKLGDLKRCLVDSFYGTELGFRASVETRAEIVELVNQLEAANPTPAPTEAAPLINGNWVLLYTAFSELLPLIAAGTLPLLKLKRISQAIDTGSQTIVNTAAFSSPLATLSFSASASFEVRSPSRIQVKFKEGIFPPPEISPTVNLPEKIDVFGQKIDLLPVQRSLNPLQEAVANAARVISGQPPLKVPIPGDRSQSFLVTTYLDKDLRISRGDGGLFVLAKEGSPLLVDQ
ncbi:plastoglobulin-1, chloroplastic [Magnolia sinica]|uniref:plastoglobulin-1, chloroplastic n=1 Tax=Magnolia sinica TaxID=86752 RepID=UPI00265AB598|nr:plastoglobulin-1, chloroplastic [Magnolia sinica]